MIIECTLGRQLITGTFVASAPQQADRNDGLSGLSYRSS
jgi:hypothetical protein